jgi:hypothetical protein
MGGWGSGRRGGKPVKEDGLTIDLTLMLRKGWMTEGRSSHGSLSWSDATGWSATIGYTYDLSNPETASLTLTYRNKRGGDEWVSRQQHVRMVYTVPPYGGRRWWMLCPVRGDRVAKLYLPNSGDIFAGRKAWRLSYRSQRLQSLSAYCHPAAAGLP